MIVLGNASLGGLEGWDGHSVKEHVERAQGEADGALYETEQNKLEIEQLEERLEEFEETQSKILICLNLLGGKIDE